MFVSIKRQSRGVLADYDSHRNYNIASLNKPTSAPVPVLALVLHRRSNKQELVRKDIYR